MRTKNMLLPLILLSNLFYATCFAETCATETCNNTISVCCKSGDNAPTWYQTGSCEGTTGNTTSSSSCTLQEGCTCNS